MSHNIDTTKGLDKTRYLHGRKVIYSSVPEVTEENVVAVIQKAMEIHNVNSSECDYLWKYRNGVQPILFREKKGSYEDICSKICENRASEIIDFKIGYYVGEPIQYTSKKDDDKSLSEMALFNNFFYAVNKASQDQDIVEWQMVAGTAFRIVLPNGNRLIKKEKPFEMFTLDPRYTFVVYSVDMEHRPLCGVQYYTDETDTKIEHYTCYTPELIFTITNGVIEKVENNPLGRIPIIEYPANNARIGAFEIVLPLLDAINDIDSNRLDGIEQTVQAFIKFINCEIDKDQFEEFKEMGAIMVKSVDGGAADVDVVTTNLDQNQTQTAKDDIYESVLEICGMPARTGGASTSDTGAAVILRDGYALAESRAKVFENMFKRSEMQMIDLARFIVNSTEGITPIALLPWEIETKFTRRNYENITSKAQVLCEMLDNPKIDPIFAYQSCGLFPDPEAAYVRSMKYYEDTLAKYDEPKEVNEDEEFVRASGQINSTAKDGNNERV